MNFCSCYHHNRKRKEIQGDVAILSVEKAVWGKRKNHRKESLRKKNRNSIQHTTSKSFMPSYEISLNGLPEGIKGWILKDLAEIFYK